MRVIKPQRLSLLQRVIEVRGERLLIVGVTAYLPLDAPETPLPEISMWQEVPKHVGKDVALDEVLPKPRGEFLLFGKGFAPGGKSRPAFSVRAQVGAVDKSVHVIGKRRWVRGVPSEPEPLTELTLGWDKAYGGPAFEANPLGMGHAPVEVDGAKVHWLPQLEDPRRLMKSPNDRPPPAAFGPLDVTSPLRRAHVGTYDARWLEQDFPGFARDINPEYFMSAPLDQRLPDYFTGGEPIVLENLHPEEARLSGRVPQLAARLFVTRAGSDDALEDVRTRLDTLVLLPNARRMVAIYRGVVRVVEDDAADVTCLLAALERPGAPRQIDHYRAVLAQRLDKKKGHLLALRDRDLLPEADPDAPPLPDEKFSDMEDLIRREGVMERRAHARAQRELDEARRSAHVLGIDPDEKGIPREVPPPETPPKLDELADYMEQVEQEVARLESEAKSKQDEALAQARQNLAEHGVDLDEAIAKAQKEGGGPPKFRAEEHLAQMRETARIGRELGAPMEEFEAQLEDPVFMGKLQQLEQAQLSTYRMTAHHLPPAAPLADEAQRQARARVEEARAEGRSMAGWDLTSADLRGLDLSEADLREALLEGADLAGTDLSRARLEGAVLVRTNLAETRLEGARLEGTNLGEVRAAGADLRGAHLGKAVLWRGDLSRAKLDGADLRGADLFEARLPEASLAGAVADEVLFYECDLERAHLERSSLRKATFFRARMADADLSEATLEGTVFVEVVAERMVFRAARANNLRLVVKCALDGADFSRAALGLATMRGVSLRKALFDEIVAEGCDMSESDLREARLDGAGLKGARFIRADLGNASLVGANLMEAMLQNAKMPGTNFQRANLFRANLMGARGDAGTSFREAHVARALFTRRSR